MNIFFCGKIKTNTRTGGEYYLSQIINYLQRKNFIISCLESQDFQLLDGDGDYFKKNLFFYKKLKSIPANTIVIQNILHIDYLKCFLANILIRYKRKDLKFILIVQQIYQFEFGLIKRILNSIILKIYIRSFHRIITTSNYLKKEIGKLKGNSNSVVAIGAAGNRRLKVERFNKQRSGTAIRLLCVGHIREIKGQLVLIEALKYLYDLNWTLILVGDTSTEDKYYEKTLNEKIGTYGLSKRIILRGRLEGASLSEEYRTSDILIVPSLYEGYGMVVREGMSFGLPIVASNVGGIPEQIRDGIDGFLVPPGDPDALALALQELIDNPDLRISMGKRGRKRLNELPTWDDVCERFYQVVEECSH